MLQWTRCSWLWLDFRLCSSVSTSWLSIYRVSPHKHMRTSLIGDVGQHFYVSHMCWIFLFDFYGIFPFCFHMSYQRRSKIFFWKRWSSILNILSSILPNNIPVYKCEEYELPTHMGDGFFAIFRYSIHYRFHWKPIEIAKGKSWDITPLEPLSIDYIFVTILKHYGSSRWSCCVVSATWFYA